MPLSAVVLACMSTRYCEALHDSLSQVLAESVIEEGRTEDVDTHGIDAAIMQSVRDELDYWRREAASLGFAQDWKAADQARETQVCLRGCGFAS